jgi:hypothetical protein
MLVILRIWDSPYYSLAMFFKKDEWAISLISYGNLIRFCCSNIFSVSDSPRPKEEISFSSLHALE